MIINSERGLQLESPIKNTLETNEPERICHIKTNEISSTTLLGGKYIIQLIDIESMLQLSDFQQDFDEIFPYAWCL